MDFCLIMKHKYNWTNQGRVLWLLSQHEVGKDKIEWSRNVKQIRQLMQAAGDKGVNKFE